MANMTETQSLANSLIRTHGLVGWRFKWDGARKRGGLCNHTHQHISMSRYLVPMWEDEAVKQILFHEVAHAIVGPGHGHDSVWLAQARALGYYGGRTHSEPTVAGQWVAVCPTHGRGTRRYHRRRNLMCGRCYKQGIVNKLTYAQA